MAGKPTVAAEECSALGAPDRTLESFPNTNVMLGNLPVARALPVRGRRLVGPWCFLDRFGPLTFADEKPMDVAPHPHIGLQTVTWLLDGEILHDDSLGCEAVARPGGVNVMTAGAGIAHAEQTPLDNSSHLDGVQLWVALPEAHRNIDPAFEGLTLVPGVEQPGGVIQVFAGSLAGAASPARHYSGIVGADVQVHPGEAVEIGLEQGYEHAVLVLRGDCSLEGRPLPDHQLHYLGVRRSSVSFRSRSGARILLIGGPPFPETVLMWWNFVARTPDEIARAREDWEQHQRFGEVSAYRGPRLAAPDLVRFARPNLVS
ncbi:MAG TPA: pirin family protein [Bryobacteraceae bacterium]|nr:pirin family protein [Bryobacteraceae bacterium]